MAIVAVTVTVLNRSTDWETVEQNEAGSTSPVGIGGTLEQFPAALYPSYPDCENCGDVTRTLRRELAGEDLLPQHRGVVGTPGLKDDNIGMPTGQAQSGPQFLNLPTDFPGLTLPTHVDHDGAVVAAASVRVRALGGVLSESEMRAVLKVAGWPPSEIPNALRVSFCESRWSAYATNGVDNGLFGMSSAQNATLRGGWLTYWGFSEEQTFDPVTNATAALWTWQRSGWTPWSCRIAVY